VPQWLKKIKGRCNKRVKMKKIILDDIFTRIYEKQNELEKRIAALEGQVQKQPIKIKNQIDGKTISQINLEKFDS
jgi:uncharacterized protein YdcH (DUF465 family)